MPADLQILRGMAFRARKWAGRLHRRAQGESPAGEWYELADVERLRALYYQSSGGQAPQWDPYRHAHMRLPAWFRHGLDPWSGAYRDQQLRLWQQIVGIDRDYVPETDEQEFGWEGIDAVRRPGYYQRRDPLAIGAAGDHWLATAMLLKHCGLKAGDRALEYGPGFGQSALALARMGVEVDTVDISPTFCSYIQQQADFFQVPLQAYQGRFGLNPRPGERYKLIWFYESFHHCLDFHALVPQMAEMLADGGKVILSGEPIVEHEYAAVPYPWGVRLHAEVAAVMRQTRWFELGFSEAFLYDLFARSGLVGRRVDNDASLFGRLYIFERAMPLAQEVSDTGPAGKYHPT